MADIIIGSIWFIIGGMVSLVLVVRFFLAFKRKVFVISFNPKRLALFVGLMIAAQVVPVILMQTPGVMEYSYLWPFAYSLNLLLFVLILRLLRIQFSRAEMLFPLFPLVPGIIFWIVQKESGRSVE